MTHLRDLKRLTPRTTSEIHQSWRYLENLIQERNWDFNPNYQRSSVWTEEQAGKYIGYCLEGGSSPPVWVQRWDSPKNAKHADFWDHAEVIDGKQRLTTILRWMNGEFPAVLTDGTLVWKKDIEGQETFLPDIKIHYVDLDEKQRLEFYLRLNCGGTPHTDEEINRVRDLLKEL